MLRGLFLKDIDKEVVALVEEKIVNGLLGTNFDAKQREAFTKLLREESLEERIIEIEVPQKGEKGVVIDGGTLNFDSMILGISKNGGNKRMEKRKMQIRDARPILEELEAERIMEEEHDVKKEAIAAVEESGIVFIDEIDKLVSSGEYRSADASSEGVQRDLLPLIEGSSISTKHGNVNTDFILFIASGAFHSSKPSGEVNQFLKTDYL